MRSQRTFPLSGWVKEAPQGAPHCAELRHPHGVLEGSVTVLYSRGATGQ